MILEFKNYDKHNLGKKDFQVILPKRWISLLENLASKHGVTLSWILRSIAQNPMQKKIPELKRPRKFSEPMHRIPICMYGKDKSVLKQKLAHLNIEFGSYIRYLLEVYGPELENIIRNKDFIKEIRETKIKSKFKTRKSRNVYQFQTIGIKCKKYEYWPRNPISNIRRMIYGRYRIMLSEEEALNIMVAMQSWEYPITN